MGNTTSILCLNKKSLKLYKQSIETLMASECFDYMVYKVSDKSELPKEDAEEWLTSVSIDDAIYIILHQGLCKKLRKFAQQKFKKE
ncbi:MAG: hypothetical protein V3U92_03405 [Cellulophaga sp.]